MKPSMLLSLRILESFGHFLTKCNTKEGTRMVVTWGRCDRMDLGLRVEPNASFWWRLNAHRTMFGRCSTFHVGFPCPMLEHVGTCWNMLERVGTCWNMLEHVGTCWNMLEHVGTFTAIAWILTSWNLLEHSLPFQKVHRARSKTISKSQIRLKAAEFDS